MNRQKSEFGLENNAKASSNYSPFFIIYSKISISIKLFMKKIFSVIFIFLFGLNFLVLPALGSTIPFASSTERSVGSNTVTPKELPNPLGTDNPNILVGNIINFILGFVGTIALVLFIYGGFTWMLSAGSTDKVKKGKNIIIWAVIGLFVVFAAYILVRFVIQGVTGIA
jgi:hypothetical protein